MQGEGKSIGVVLIWVVLGIDLQHIKQLVVESILKESERSEMQRINVSKYRLCEFAVISTTLE